MAEAAIRKDVVDAGGEDETTRGTEIVREDKKVLDIGIKSSRDEMMELIAKRRKEEVEAEMAEEFGSDEDEVIEEEIDLEPEPTHTEVKPQEPATRKIKVDGQEIEVTDKEIREYQKHIAADRRLEEISKRDKELADRQARIEARERELEAERQREAERRQAAEVEPIDAKAIARKFIDSVTMEDEDTAAAIIQELVKTRGAERATPAAPAKAVIDRTEVIRAVDDALVERDRQAAISRFDREYPELAKRTGLRNEVNQRTIIEMQNDPNATWWDIIDRAAKHVKAEILEIAGVQQPQPVEKDDVKKDLKERAAKKVGMSPVVKPTVSVKSTVTETRQPVLSVVDQMKKARGQL